MFHHLLKEKLGRCEAQMRQRRNTGSARVSVVGKPKGTEMQCGNGAIIVINGKKLCRVHKKFAVNEQGEDAVNA